MISLPSFDLSPRLLRVWQRNLIVYKKTWKINFLPPLLEPLFYLVAFGVGLSTFINTVNYRGMDLPYISFITPSLLAINIMYSAFFENTYASFVRMYYQKTFDAMMATPLSVEEVITGEILWGATKSLIATVLMLAVVSMFGLVQYPEALIVLPLSFLGGMAFGSVGMFFTGIVRSIELFNLPVFLFITPMFLFSGTFFPVANLPAWAAKLALIFPLTHLVQLTRDACVGYISLELVSHLVYLLLFCLVFFPLALASMKHRLVQ
jgi:lipooligosaccharide transport system permease protein